MAGLKIESTHEQDTLCLHEKNLRRIMVLASGQGVIKRGQALMFDETTGKLKKYIKGDITPFTISTMPNDVDATATDVNIEVATFGALLDKSKVIGIATDDYKAIHAMYLAGMILEEVR